MDAIDSRDRIVVAGAGPAGLTAALGLARQGRAVTLVGPQAAAEDRRTTALMVPALSLLGRLGLREALDAHGTPLEAMRLVDATSRLIRAPAVTFRAAEIGEACFGLNLPNSALNAVLAEAVSREPLIERVPEMIEGWDTGTDRVAARLADGRRVEASLAVAADGRRSAARQAAGISNLGGRASGQAALVLNFGHARPHGFVSTEFQSEDGPFTQVPLRGERSSLVWMMRSAATEEMTALDDATLSRRIEDRMQSMLGRVAVEPGRQVYPLTSALPSRFAARRIMLVGEAAHVFPPIGAQGLNLGLRDVADMLDTVARHPDDPGSAAALAAYDARRRPDVLARAGSVGLLNRSLLSDMLPVQLARGLGLGLLGKIAPLRAFAMREGLSPGSGWSALLAGLRGTGRPEARRS